VPVQTRLSRQHPHTKLINAAAREILRPLGLVQAGRSRTWIDDRAWWLGIVEFQPSNWTRGSYLNVGVNWLWNIKDWLSFDFGHRVGKPGEGETFIEYESDDQFAPLARKLTMAAAEQVVHYRQLFPTVEAAVATLSGTAPDNLERSLDAGVALGLVGESDAAAAMFDRYIRWFKSGEEAEWRSDDDEPLYERATMLRDLAGDTSAFRDRIRADVQETRTLLKLDLDPELPF
jgi:hypothetical protein